MRRSILRCQVCRHSLLDSFAALAGISIPSQSLQPLRPQSHQLLPQRRNYISTPNLRQALPLSDTSTPQEQPDETSMPPATESTSTLSSDSIPWYLQVPTPDPPAPISPILALQEIPPLPQDSPTLLEPLLQHLSIQIGLDNLSLLDLRSIHPPPALGANLLMIIGTARSVKHLNVSADRVCRWLRTEWKLRPYADGLLGRNELKLKLRRKARRQKMLGLVGGREVGPVDDGITTGWVCVNVGMVDESLQPREKVVNAEDDAQEPFNSEDVIASSAETEALQEEEYQNPDIEDLDQDASYAGFGSRTTFPRIVVQMFTEEKRLEMDLEGLWEDRNTRRVKKDGQRDLRALEGLRQKEDASEGFENVTKGFEDVDLDEDEDTDTGRKVRGKRQRTLWQDRSEQSAGRGAEERRSGVWGE